MDKTKNSLFIKGILVLMASQVVIKILGFAYKVYLTNKEGFGDIGNAINGAGFHIYMLLLAVSSIGVPNAISKLVSERLAVGDKKGAHRIFKISFAFFALIGLIGTLLLLFGSRYISGTLMQIPEAEFTLICLAPSIFFVSCASVLRGYFNGRECLDITAKSQAMEQVFKAVLTIALVEAAGIVSMLNTTKMVAAANLATTVATFLGLMYIFLFYYMLRRRIWSDVCRSANNINQEKIRTIIKRVVCIALPITISAIMASMNKNIDSVTVVRGLKTFLSEEDAKIQYGILTGKVDNLVMFPLSFNIALATALVPSIAAAAAIKDKITVSKRIEFSLLLTILIGLPCTVGLFIFARPILELVFPNQSSGEMILKLSSLTIIYNVLIQTISGALQGLGKVIIPGAALGIAVIIKLILDILLIPNPNIGIYGAIIACLISYGVAFLIIFITLIKSAELKLSIFGFIIKPIISTTIMGVCSYFVYVRMGQGNIATLLAILSAILIYLGLAAMLHGKQLILLYFFKKKKEL